MTVPAAVQVGGVTIHPASLDDAVDDALMHAIAHDGACLRFTNTWCIVLADRDPDYMSLLNDSGENFADGRPVADAIARRGGRRNAHVRGMAFFERMLELGQRSGLRHFFYGADERTLAALTRRVSEKYPDAIIAGSLAPPIATADELCAPEFLARIGSAEPDIVWVGLGTPKQDFVATRIASELHLTAAAVGAAFDFMAGTKAPAPVWMQRMKLEWLFRFASEPRRLWERYTVGILSWERLMWHERRRAA